MADVKDVQPPQNDICLPEGLDAGDLVLFNRRCLGFSPYGAAVCFAAKAWANSRWDHVGIIIREADGALQLLDAGFGGVRKFPLEQRLRQSKSEDIVVRRIGTPRTDELRRTLLDFSEEVVKAPYKKEARELLRVIKLPTNTEAERLTALEVELVAELKALEKQSRQVAHTSQSVLQEEYNRVQRQLRVVRGRLTEEGRIGSVKGFEAFDVSGGLFCSELVAAAYQRLGLLADYPPATKYMPHDFAWDAASPLILLNQAFLSPHEYVKQSNRFQGAAAPSSCKIDPIHVQRALKFSRLHDLLKNEERTQQFMQSLRPIVVQPGQVIFSPGDYPEAFWIVESGKIERRMNPQGTTDSVVVTSLGPGSEVGLRGLTYDTPRAATCVAKEPSVLWRCDRATFRRFLLEFADCRTIRDLTERRMLYSILTDHYLFKRLDRLPGPEVIDRFFNVDLQPGEVLWEQGTEGRNFYVVKSGHLELSERGGNSYVLGPGDSFGASALIFNTRRYYRVVAKGRVQCWALHAHDFHALHLADNAQHLKRAFQTHATKERQRVIMRPEDFLRFSGARETFPPDKYERLCAFLLALVTLNRLGRSGATADNPGPGPGGGAEAGAWDHIHFYEFVRFHLTIDRPTATLPAEIAFRLVDRTQRGTVTLASLRGFLEEFYGQREATEMLATMAVDAPQAMAVLLKSLDEPLSLKGFRDIYESLPKEVREDMDLLVQQSKKFTVPALRDADLGDASTVLGTGAAPPSLEYLDRRKIFVMQLSAAAGLTLVAPLERVQMWRQTAAVHGTRRLPLRLELSRFWRRDGGVAGLLRGNAVALGRIVPAAALQYGVMQTLCSQSSPGLYWEIGCGAAAGLIASVATHPLDVLRVRVALTKGPGASPVRRAAAVLRQEGARALWRGVVPSVVGVFPYIGVNFGMYQYYALQHSIEGQGLDVHMSTPSVVFWAGMGCALHQLLLYPVDTCRRVMQLDPHCGGVLRTARAVYTARGLQGLYSGLVPSMLRIIPALGAGVTTWKACMSLTGDAAQ